MSHKYQDECDRAINWDDPVARYELIARVGPTAYNRLHKQAIDASIVECVNGYSIRLVGRLLTVDGTGKAFGTIEAARKFARLQPA